MFVMLLVACAPDTDSAAAPDSAVLDSGDAGSGSAWCPSSQVVFVPEDGFEEDLSDALLTGSYLTLDQPGTLHVCPGTWYARVLVRAAIVVQGEGNIPADTVMSGGESGTILDVLGPAGSVEVHNVTLDRGAGLDVDHNSGGGGIYCEGEGSVLAEDVVFSNNFANDGPGLYTRYCEATVRRSTFVDNVAEDDGGAATSWYSTSTFEEVVFRDNVALDGGALAVFYGAATVTGSTIAGNHADHFAGGLWANESTLVMRDTAVANNVAPASDGGGVLLAGDGTFEQVSFVDNASPRGGGLFVYYDSTVACSHCSFAGNPAEDLFVADYSDAGGVSMSGSPDWSFSCANNLCLTDE